jgi:hypothetical protein
MSETTGIIIEATCTLILSVWSGAATIAWMRLKKEADRLRVCNQRLNKRLDDAEQDLRKIANIIG